LVRFYNSAIFGLELFLLTFIFDTYYRFFWPFTRSNISSREFFLCLNSSLFAKLTSQTCFIYTPRNISFFFWQFFCRFYGPDLVVGLVQGIRCEWRQQTKDKPTKAKIFLLCTKTAINSAVIDEKSKEKKVLA